MVPDPSKTCLGLEYFCFEGDGLWSMSDQELVELGKRELDFLGLARAEDVEEGAVVRMPKAYPVYDSNYRDALATIRKFLDPLENLQLVGRNGMHKYNNQDHSMLTAMLAVKNILGEKHDLWEVNVEQEYHEEMTDKEAKDERMKLASTQPLVPERIGQLSPVEQSLMRTFSKMDKLAFATALGTVSCLMVWVTTMWLVIKGGDVVGPNLQLLSHYFIGYTVTITGAFIGMAYSFFWGFLWGWLFAYLRNFILGLVIYRIKKQMEMVSFRDFLDHF
jgi:DNA-binding transcriptional regulator YiaG